MGLCDACSRGQANNHFNSNKINPNLHPKPPCGERFAHIVFPGSLFFVSERQTFFIVSPLARGAAGVDYRRGESHFGKGWAVFGASRGIVCNVKLA